MKTEEENSDSSQDGGKLNVRNIISLCSHFQISQINGEQQGAGLCGRWYSMCWSCIDLLIPSNYLQYIP